MRIAQVTSSLAPPLGGAEQYCVELTMWLAAAGHEVVLVGHGASDELRARAGSGGVRIVDAPIRRPYAPGARSENAVAKALFHGMDVLESVAQSPASRAIRQGRFDVVHVHRWPGFGTSVMREDRVLAPTVHTVHDFALVDSTTTTTRRGRFVTRLPLGQRIRAMLLAHTARQIGAAVFPTERTRDRHAELGFRMPAGGDRIIPHGWRLPPPVGATRRVDDRFAVLYMGKLVDEKGVRTLLEAWGEGVPGAVLRIAGAGALEQLVQSRSGRTGIEFLGWLTKEQQAEALTTTDILVLPSLWPENFPLVVAESLIAGVPVVATTTNAPAILHDGVNAAVVAPTVEALRRVLLELPQDRARVEHLRAGATVSAADLDFDLHGRRVLRAYADVVERWGSGRT